MFRLFKVIRTNSNATAAAPKQEARFFEHQFRCPVCFAGDPVRCDDPSPRPSALSSSSSPTAPPPPSTEVDNKKKKTNGGSNNNRWMSGPQLEHHFRLPELHYNKRVAYLSRNNHHHRHAVVRESASDKDETNNNRNNPFFTSAKFEKEMEAVLTSLPCTSLIDRILVFDTSNVQMSRNISPGLLLSAHTQDLLWEAFKKRRVVVVFVHEHQLQYSAPMFNFVGALAEGSANVHDAQRWWLRGDEWRLKATTMTTERETEKPDVVVVGNNSTRAALDKLVEACSSRCDENESDSGRVVAKKSPPVWFSSSSAAAAAAQIAAACCQIPAPDQNQLAREQHPFRPWNSVTIPTIRGTESGDIAIFRVMKRLEEILCIDEEYQQHNRRVLARKEKRRRRQQEEHVSSSCSEENDEILLRKIMEPLKNRRRNNNSDGNNKSSSSTMMMRRRRPSLLTKLDVVTFDTELTLALKATVGSSGRLKVFTDIVEFAADVARE